MLQRPFRHKVSAHAATLFILRMLWLPILLLTRRTRMSKCDTRSQSSEKRQKDIPSIFQIFTVLSMPADTN